MLETTWQDLLVVLNGDSHAEVSTGWAPLSSAGLEPGRLHHSYRESLGVNTPHETSHIHAGPVGILRFEFHAQLLSRIVSRNALPLQCQGARPEIVDESSLLPNQGPITRCAMVGKNVTHIERCNLVENRDPTRGRPSVWIGI